MSGEHLLLAAHCYGGVASTAFARSLLALEAACMVQGLRLQTSLGGGEALVSRARAGMLAGFLESSAERLLLLDGDRAFDPEELLGLVRAGKEVAGRAPDAEPGLHAVEAIAPGLLVITRQAAERMAAGYPQLKGGMRDVRGVSVANAPMVFDGFVDAATGRYVADMDAFCARWRGLGGEVWGFGGELSGGGAPAPAAPSVGERLKPAFQAMARGDYATAERVMREVAKAEPGSNEAEHALAALLSTLGQVEEAESRFRRALELKPGHPETELGLALVCLMRGKTEEGWRLYEARNRTRTGAPKPRLAFPEWRGEPLAGKSLHILSDEGFGDQIQQARAVQALADQGANVTVLCAPALQRLFAQSLPAQVLAATGQVSVSDPDYWILFGDVLGRMGLGPEAAPKPPYLRAANPAAPPGARIGLMTAGNPAHPNNLHRSMPERFAERLRAIPGAISLAPEATGAKDFADTADIVAGLDLVISVDTSVAHLAGALGKPVWILLPFLGLDWRWGLSGSTSAWYPSARLFRQPRLEAWADVVAEVLEALASQEAPQKSG